MDSVGREIENNQDARMMAMLANLLPIVTWLIGPAVIFFMKGNENRFVKFHALQAIYAVLIGTVLAIVTCGIGWIALIVFNVIVGLKAKDGEWYEYPLVGKWAMR